MAEAVFKQLARSDGLTDHFDVSSRGTKNWDVGLRPDPRTIQILQDHHYFLESTKRAEQITPNEISTTDFLIAMSKRVAEELNHPKKTHFLMAFVEHAETLDIPDPYPTNTFPEAFKMIEEGVKAFYYSIKQAHNLSRS
jgi:protein-tyrosine phosphatase